MSQPNDSSLNERTVAVPRSSETVCVAVGVAVYQLNQRAKAATEKVSDSELVDVKQDDSIDLKGNHMRMSPSYVHARATLAEVSIARGGPIGYLHHLLLHGKRRRSVVPRWLILEEKSDKAKKKTVFAVNAGEALLSVVVQGVGERTSQVHVKSAVPGVLEEFLGELDNQLKWRE